MPLDRLQQHAFDFQWECQYDDAIPPIEYMMDENTSSIPAVVDKLGAKVLTKGDLNTPTNIQLEHTLTNMYDLNRTYRDIEITPDVSTLHHTYYNIRQKATRFRPLMSKSNITDINSYLSYGSTSLNSSQMLRNAITHMADTLGIEVEYVSPQEFDDISKTPDAKGCVRDGKVYLNSKYADDSTRVHELMHLLVEPMKYLNPYLYDKFLGVAQQLSISRDIKSRYGFLLSEDADEEVMVEAIARYVTDKLSKSDKDLLQQRGIGELIYDLKYNIDSMFSADYSATNLSDSDVFDTSISELQKAINGSFRLSIQRSYNSLSHDIRMLTNMKSDLYQKNLLFEHCS